MKDTIQRKRRCIRYVQTNMSDQIWLNYRNNIYGYLMKYFYFLKFHQGNLGNFYSYALDNRSVLYEDCEELCRPMPMLCPR